MPFAKVRGANINYEIYGKDGPWVALSPGGRRSLDGVEGLAKRVAAGGFRVLIHDRRNCGLSDLVLEGKESEYDIWADDLHELLKQHNALPAYVGGSSSGCRTALLFALRHPQAVRGLLLWRVTGGAFAANRLAENYYGKYITAAKEGGMKAVSELEHFGERCEENPNAKKQLLAVDPQKFIATMTHWRTYFLDGAELPVIGATEADLKSIKVPTLIVPGNDRTHGHAVGQAARRLIPGAEYYDLMKDEQDIDLTPVEEWIAKDDELAGVFVDFLKRHARVAA